MLKARFFIPIFAFARTMPIMRTSVPPMSLACAPKTCSTRARTEDLVRLLLLACSVRGLPRMVGNENAVEAGTLRKITFGGKDDIVVPPGAPVVSDPLDMTRRGSGETRGLHLPAG